MSKDSLYRVIVRENIEACFIVSDSKRTQAVLQRYQNFLDPFFASLLAANKHLYGVTQPGSRDRVFESRLV